MSMIEVIGYLAAFCTTMSFLPQVIKVLKTRDTRSLSLSMYSVFVFGVLMWCIYGFYRGDLPIIVANLFTLLFATIIFTVKFKNRKIDKL